AAGVKLGGEWITPEAYWRDARGGRSVRIDAGDYQFGAAALTSRRESIEARLAKLDARLTEVARRQSETNRQLDDAKKAGMGQTAARERAERSEEFAQAREQLPALKQARIQASRRWQSLEAEFLRNRDESREAEGRYRDTQNRLEESERLAQKFEQEWSEHYRELRERAARSRTSRSRFARGWITPGKLADLRARFTNATQARLRLESIEQELTNGQWEIDTTVEDKAMLMRSTVAAQQGELEQRKAHNEKAVESVMNARERYMDVLRST